MTVYLVKLSGRVILMARAEGPGIIGDAQFEVRPGESAFGRSFEEWAALPEGPYEGWSPRSGRGRPGGRGAVRSE